MNARRGFPELRQVVLDATDARGLAEFYRQLLGLRYRPGDELPAAGEPDPAAERWLVLWDAAETPWLAFQSVPGLPEVTWPDGPVPQQPHLDLTVATTAELDVQHERALAFGARLLSDQADDPEEPLRVYADPAGHPFRVCVAPVPAPAGKTTGHAVVVADTDGVITRWNAGARALFGYPAEQAVGQSLDLIVPEHLREAHWAGFRRAMREPQVKDLAADLPVRCADGEVRHFAGRLLVLGDGLGTAIGAMAIYAGEGTTGIRPFG